MSPTDEPPNERVLDELLSADLDGELAAAAADLGLTLDEANAAIASPAAIARRGELARASELVAAPVPLDPEVAARLVTASINQRQDNEVGAARQRRERRTKTARRVLVAAGSAAAVIAVIVGLTNMSPSANNDMESAATSPTENADSSNQVPDRPVALGDVSGEEQLRRSVEFELRAPAAQPGSETTATARSSGRPSPTEAFASDRAAKRNVAACLPPTQATAGGAAPVLTGQGTSGGRPVSVYVFRSGNAYDVVVVSRDCSVVDRLSLP